MDRSDRFEDVAAVAPVPEAGGLKSPENVGRILTKVQVDLSKSDAIRVPMSDLKRMGVKHVPSLESAWAVMQTTMDGSNAFKLVSAASGAQAAKILTMSSGGATVASLLHIDPAPLLMGAVLVSVERRLNEIIEIERKIITMLEHDKEAKIEGDLKTLSSIAKEFKFNWEIEEYRNSHYKLVLDVKRSADHNIIFYQKQAEEIIRTTPAFNFKRQANARKEDLIKRMQYYKMSVYIYAFASFLEIMLLGNHDRMYIEQVRDEIRNYMAQYREVFEACSVKIERLTDRAVDKAALKALGSASQAVGRFIGRIPGVNRGRMDEWLAEKGEQLHYKQTEAPREMAHKFAQMANTDCQMFIEQLDRVNAVFNDTKEIYIDRDAVYLASEPAEEA